MNNLPVVVAMSGGVDSSVAAGLLVEGGYRVVGMMLRLWSEAGIDEKNRCCAPDAVAQARRVAAILDIPFYVIDAKDLFRQTVVEAFIAEYRDGRTPNPCVLCNKVIRWGFLLDHARKIGAEYLATGHYARVFWGDDGQIQLRKGCDSNKDQSYVLSRLNQEQLAHSMFPLGEMSKSQVREHARRMHLPVADRAESQDLCFLSEGDYRPFLHRHAPETVQPGYIINLHGDMLGLHQGLAFYTIGQRKGLGIAAPYPLYVIEKDLEKNALVVGTEQELGQSQFWVRDFHWITGEAPREVFKAEVKIRYKANLAIVRIEPMENRRAKIELEQTLRDITPGQLAVFYGGDTVLGSGIIDWREK